MLRNSFESKKQKYKSKAMVNNNEESRPSSPLRETTASNIGKPPSSQSLRKALEQMSMALSQEKEMKAALQEKVILIYSRSIQRQRQFQTLLQETIPFCKNQQKIELSSQKFYQIHQQILSFFEQSNQQTENKLSQTTKELEGIMDRKIKAIIDHMEKELKKSKALLKLNHQTITNQIKRIINLSQDVLDQNDEFRKHNQSLTLKNEMLREEKKLLIAQVLQKKQLILKLYEELKDKYKKDDLVKEEIQILKKQRKQVQKQYQDYERQIRSKLDCQDQVRAKSIYAFRAEDNFVNPGKKSRPTSKYITTECSYSNSCQSTGKRQAKTKQESRLVTTIEVRNNYQTSKSFYPNKTQTIATSDIFEKEDEKVNNLRIIVRKQRRKNSELTKKLNQYIVYQQEMDNLLKDLFLNEEDKSSEDPSIFKNSGKIYHMTKELGRRLMSSSNPVVNSGFNDLQNLLEEVEVQKIH